MRRDEALQILAGSRDKLRELSIKSLALFGSVARDEATDSSDIDLLVEFEAGRPSGLFEFIRVMNYLEDLLGCKVDLVMLDALRKEFREQVLRAAIRAA
jgi:predicted nucleotidyltransferase